MTSRKIRRFQLAMAVLTVSACMLAGLLAEFVLRESRRYPWEWSQKYAQRPQMRDPDPVLGWRNRPGKHQQPAYDGKGPDIHTTFLSDGRRDSGPGNPDGFDLVLVGGSYTAGMAISDHETFAWKLQNERPEIQVRNYAVGAFGTYQASLMVDDILQESPPDMIVYGFLMHHERRSVAAFSWELTLAKNNHEPIYLPHVRLPSAGDLVRHESAGYRPWPLAKTLSSVNHLQQLVGKWGGRARLSEARPAVEQLLLRMSKRCDERNAKFAVMFLAGGNSNDVKHYLEFGKKNGVQVLDCHMKLTKERKVPREGHPNAVAHQIWADCLLGHLTEAIRETDANQRNEAEP